MRICFSCPMALPLFETHVSSPFGGSEVRAYHFARGLTQLGHQVQMLVQTHGDATPRFVEGVELYFEQLPSPLRRSREFASRWQYLRAWPELTLQKSMRSLRKLWTKGKRSGPQIVRPLMPIPADIYACFGVHEHAANVVLTAATLGKPSVLMLASDTDLDPGYREGASGTNQYRQRASSCAFALRHASRIVAQTEDQRESLQQRFGRDATVIRNPYAMSSKQVPEITRKHDDVLWIGRADTFSKRADLAIQIARLCPKLSFRLVLNRRDTRVYDDLTKNLPGNVCVTDYVPYRQVDELFRSTRCLLNTSDAEGFPNTYLQAASHGIPIVSLRVDPDGILTRHGCGRVVNGSVDAAATQLLEWYQNTASYCQAASAGPEFVRRFHLAADRCRELSELLLACKPTDRQPATPSDKQRELAA